MAASDVITIDPAYYAAPEFIDPFVGHMSTFWRCRAHASVPNTYIMGAQTCDTREMYPDRIAEHVAPWSCGINLDVKSARLGCIFEAIERYCSAIIPYETLLWASQQQLRAEGFDCVRCETFDYFTPEQYAAHNTYHPWTPASVMRWTLGRRLRDDREIYLPAQLVYCPYVYAEKETVLFDPFSTGLAAHRTLNRAIYSGLCEVIERDSFMIFWHNMLRSPRIDLESIYGMDEEIDRLLAVIHQVPNLAITVKDLTTDTRIPTLLSILYNPVDRNSAAAAFAAATDLDPIRALAKAMNECIGSYMYAHRLRFDDSRFANVRVNPARWDRTHALDDHVVNFGHHEIHGYIGWAFEGDRTTMEQILQRYPMPRLPAPPWPTADGPAAILLHTCVERLEACGLEAMYTDITSGEVAPTGFRVARVCIPGAVPLYANHPTRPRGCRRFRSVPQRIGLEHDGRINVVPHPYP